MKATYKINRNDGNGIITETIDSNALENDSNEKWTAESLEQYCIAAEAANDGSKIFEFEII